MRFSFAPTVLVAVTLGALATPRAAAAACTPTGFVRDGIDMTAAFINPPYATGEIDATGCNIGIYFSAGIVARVVHADVHGANYFGIVVNGDAGSARVDVLETRIHDIGEQPFNGTQHGVAIYYRNFGATGSGPTGRIAGNRIWRYQKGGIVTNGVGTRVTISENRVAGLGPVDFIAQNGIQVGYGATALVRENRVSGNAYTGSSTVSGGIIVVGGPFYGSPYSTDCRIVENTVVNNDVGVFLSNLAADGNAADLPTNNRVVGNTISSDAVSNGLVYQAGVSVVGNSDKIIENWIWGAGYDPATIPGATYAIDAASAINPVVEGNRIGQPPRGHDRDRDQDR